MSTDFNLVGYIDLGNTDPTRAEVFEVSYGGGQVATFEALGVYDVFYENYGQLAGDQIDPLKRAVDRVITDPTLTLDTWAVEVITLTLVACQKWPKATVELL